MGTEYGRFMLFPHYFFRTICQVIKYIEIIIIFVLY